MSVEEFVGELEDRCREFGIRIVSEGGSHYLLDVQLIPARNTTSTDQHMSS
jgi:hypothetical protein